MGATIWHPQTERRVAYLPMHAASVHFAQDGSALLAGGRGNGLQRWPIEITADGGRRIGPPATLWESNYLKTTISTTPDHRLAVINLDWGTAVLIDLETRQLRHRLHFPDVRFHAISPDGRWIATGNWRGSGVKVWDAQSGKVVRDLPVEGSVRVEFSPDGRWLATSGHDEYAIWSVTDWRPVHREQVDGFSFRVAAFSPAGDLAAISMSNGVRLIDLKSGTQLATLTPPDEYTARCMAFRPDGRELAVGTQESVIYLWRLGSLRERLAEWDLDWDQPQAAALAAPVENIEAIEIEYPSYAASSVYTDTYDVARAFDSSHETRWNSARSDSQLMWLARFWPEPQTIEQVTIHQAFDRIKALKIQQLDAVTGRWSDVLLVKDEQFAAVRGTAEFPAENDKTVNPVLDISLPEPITTRGLRVVMTSDSESVSIWEIEIR